MNFEVPQTSLWIKVNGLVGFYGDDRKEIRCCLARIHTSQDKEETSTLEKKWGNKCFIY